MTFRKAFHGLTYATALWAFLALVATAHIHPPVIILFLLAFGIAITQSRTGLNMSHRMWTLLSVVVFFGAVWAFQNVDRLYAVTYFFLYLEINKLMTARKNRDYFQIYALTFFQILAASVSTESVVFAPMLAVYVFLIIAAMMTFTIKRDAEAVLDVAPRKRGSDPAALARLVHEHAALLRRMGELTYWNRPMTVRMPALLVIVLVLGTMIFWIVPRSTRSSFLPGLGGISSAPPTSGYADEVNFGGMGEIQSDPTIIMRAIPYPEYFATRPEFLRIRGTALDTFTGRQWNRSPGARGDVATFHAHSVTFPTESLASHGTGRVFRARLTLEPESSGYIFVIDQPLGVRLGDNYHLEFDRDRLAIKNQRQRHSQISYDATGVLPLDIPEVQEDKPLGPGVDVEPLELVRASIELVQATQRRIEPTLAREARSSATPASANPIYLDLPNLSDMEVVRALAEEWSEGLSTDRQIAAEIERRFRNDFGYSLDVTFSNRDDHISYFLTQSRSAHCEYFATAMALMLRDRGIPARIVNGYLTDEWSATGRRYIVRQEHAHSWVEAQLDDSQRWTTFDPTPASGVGSNRIPSTFSRALSAWIDNIKTLWYDSFIDYTLEDQRESLIAMFSFLRSGTQRTEAAMDSISGWFGRSDGDTGDMRRTLGLVLVLGGVAGLLAVGWWYARLRRGESAATAGRRSGFDPEKIRPFLDLLGDLERLSPRSPAQTPLEYADTLAGEHPGVLGDLPTLTRDYYRVRFNEAPWSEELTERARQMRLALAESRPRPDKGTPARG